MKKAIILISLLLFSATPGPAAEIDRGELLFNDPTLGRGSNGKTCNTCHAGGLDLAINVIHKENFEIMGVKVENIREAVNFCIQVTLRGEGLDLQGEAMDDLLSYLDFIAKKGGGKKFTP